MNAVIDLGNTTAKIGLFSLTKPLAIATLPVSDLVDFVKNQKIEHALVSNVSQSSKFLAQLKKVLLQLTLFTYQTPMPITTKYATPHTLGVDRLAACVGARNYTKGNVLVIDAGTCITYDILTTQNQHLGGLISPGINMRLKAMHTFTQNLPLVRVQAAPLVGNTTEKCLQSGAVNGIFFEIKGLIQQFMQQYEDLSIIIGGGDADFFDKNFELNTFVVPNLAVEGLHAIFKYNE